MPKWKEYDPHNGKCPPLDTPLRVAWRDKDGEPCVSTIVWFSWCWNQAHTAKDDPCISTGRFEGSVLNYNITHYIVQKCPKHPDVIAAEKKQKKEKKK